MLGNGYINCEFDSANRLLKAAGHTYTYNAEDVRIRNLCDDADTTYTYNTNCKLSQLLTKTTNGVTTKYVYGNGLIGEEKCGEFKTYHFDFRGSTVAITDQYGNVTDTFKYDTYGNVTEHIGNSFVIFGYNGRDGVVTDKNGLIYMRARYYSPQMRRFVNADIIHGQISDSTSLNRYSYVNGNPVSFVDPFGLAPERGNGTLVYGGVKYPISVSNDVGKVTLLTKPNLMRMLSIIGGYSSNKMIIPPVVSEAVMVNDKNYSIQAYHKVTLVDEVTMTIREANIWKMIAMAEMESGGTNNQVFNGFAGAAGIINSAGATIEETDIIVKFYKNDIGETWSTIAVASSNYRSVNNKVYGKEFRQTLDSNSIKEFWGADLPSGKYNVVFKGSKLRANNSVSMHLSFDGRNFWGNPLVFSDEYIKATRTNNLEIEIYTIIPAAEILDDNFSDDILGQLRLNGIAVE